MAKMKLNPTVDAFSGQLGNMVHRQLWGGHVVSRPPDFSDRVLSPKQVAQNDQYKNAGRIWKALSDQAKAAYADWGKRVNKPPYALFNKNCSRPPAVEAIDVSQYHGQTGQSIGVRAVDLLEVTAVEVTVRHVAGGILEKGPAVKSLGDPQNWVYQATVTASESASLVVEAVAVNWPGKQGKRIELVS